MHRKVPAGTHKLKIALTRAGMKLKRHHGSITLVLALKTGHTVAVKRLRVRL